VPATTPAFANDSALRRPNVAAGGV